MRRIIVKSLESIAYGAIALIILGFGGAGAALMGGFLGFLVGGLAGAVLSIVFFGALFLLVDIADNTRRATQILETGRRDGATLD